MASEPKLENTSPKQNHTPAWSRAKPTRVSRPASASATWADASATKPHSAACDTRRGPKRPTMREFRKDDSAMKPAMSANTLVNSRGAPSVSLKICCAELMKPNRAPRIKVEASM